jgi:hypothetical protein
MVERLKNTEKLQSGKNISILYSGILAAGEGIRFILGRDFNNCSIKFDFANSDTTFWNLEEANNAIKNSHYDLIILFLNNLVSRYSDYMLGIETRMGKVCSFIHEVTSKNVKVVGIYGADDSFWPERVINAGAKVVYHAPLSYKRFSNDFPVIMGWGTSRDFERIVPNELIKRSLKGNSG